MTPELLNKTILECHDRGDTDRLAELYREAGVIAETNGHVDEACFHYTTAYVFALDTSKRELAQQLRTKLVRYGREEK